MYAGATGVVGCAGVGGVGGVGGAGGVVTADWATATVKRSIPTSDPFFVNRIDEKDPEHSRLPLW